MKCYLLGLFALGGIASVAHASNGLADGGFDTQGSSVSTYCYIATSGCPSGAWAGTSTALVHSSDPSWVAPPAQSPSTLIALQNSGSITQTFTATATGSFRVVWYQADRPNVGGQTFNVLINGSVVATVTPTGTSFARAGSAVFAMTSGTSYTVSFQGTTTSGDHSAFIDTVDILPATDTSSYSYDALGRLTSVARAGAAYGGITSSYTLDVADNRSNVAVTGATH